jgi:GAF domain-containing protein
MKIEDSKDPIDCAFETVYDHFAEEEKRRIARIETIHFSKGNKTYEDIVKLAGAICGTPIAIISIVGENEQTFKASTGLLITATPRSESFCAYTLSMRKRNEYLIVQDALLDPRFVNNILVTGPPFIRFYCGFPLRKNGINIGAVCVIDTEPRTLTDEQLQALSILRDHLSEWVELHPIPKISLLKFLLRKLWNFLNKKI